MNRVFDVKEAFLKHCQSQIMLPANQREITLSLECHR